MQPLNTSRSHVNIVRLHYFVVSILPGLVWIIFPGDDSTEASVGTAVWIFVSMLVCVIDEAFLRAMRELPPIAIQNFLLKVLLPSFTSLIPTAYSAMPIIECLSEVYSEELSSAGRREKYDAECGTRVTCGIYLNSWLLLLLILRVAILPLTVDEESFTARKIVTMRGLQRRYVYYGCVLVMVAAEALYYLARTESIGAVQTFDMFFGITGTMGIISVMALECRIFFANQKAMRARSASQRAEKTKVFTATMSSGGATWHDML